MWEHIILIEDGSTCTVSSKTIPHLVYLPLLFREGGRLIRSARMLLTALPRTLRRKKSEYSIGTVPQQILIQQPPKVVTRYCHRRPETILCGPCCSHTPRPQHSAVLRLPAGQLYEHRRSCVSIRLCHCDASTTTGICCEKRFGKSTSS